MSDTPGRFSPAGFVRRRRGSGAAATALPPPPGRSPTAPGRRRRRRLRASSRGRAPRRSPSRWRAPARTRGPPAPARRGPPGSRPLIRSGTSTTAQARAAPTAPRPKGWRRAGGTAKYAAQSEAASSRACSTLRVRISRAARPACASMAARPRAPVIRRISRSSPPVIGMGDGEMRGRGRSRSLPPPDLTPRPPLPSPPLPPGEGAPPPKTLKVRGKGVPPLPAGGGAMGEGARG